jgi:hypothetical protein
MIARGPSFTSATGFCKNDVMIGLAKNALLNRSYDVRRGSLTEQSVGGNRLDHGSNTEKPEYGTNG